MEILRNMLATVCTAFFISVAYILDQRMQYLEKEHETGMEFLELLHLDIRTLKSRAIEIGKDICVTLSRSLHFICLYILMLPFNLLSSMFFNSIIILDHFRKAKQSVCKRPLVSYHFNSD